MSLQAMKKSIGIYKSFASRISECNPGKYGKAKGYKDAEGIDSKRASKDGQSGDTCLKAPHIKIYDLLVSILYFLRTHCSLAPDAMSRVGDFQSNVIALLVALGSSLN